MTAVRASRARHHRCQERSERFGGEDHPSRGQAHGSRRPLFKGARSEFTRRGFALFTELRQATGWGYYPISDKNWVKVVGNE